LGAAHERPCEPPKGGGLWQSQLLLPSVLLLLFPNVVADRRFVSTDRRDEVATGPEVLPHEVALVVEERSGHRPCARRYVAGCATGPSDQEVIAAVKQSPPLAPTLGPTYLAEIESVQVLQRGRHDARGRYWPVRARVRGGAKMALTNVFQLGFVATMCSVVTAHRRNRDPGEARSTAGSRRRGRRLHGPSCSTGANTLGRRSAP
jgi:hypothetical protein